MSAAAGLLRGLASRYRADAEVFARYGQVAPAALLEQIAEDLEMGSSEHLTEPLTLEQAAEESGYSYSRLQALVADGTLRNVGEKGSPLVRRGDLPRKAARLSDGLDEPDEEEDFATSIMRSRRAG